MFLVLHSQCQEDTKFTTSINGQSYNFVNNVDVTITPVDGVYKFSNVKIFEGTYLNFKYTVSTSDIDQRFIIYQMIMLIQQLLQLKFKILQVILQQTLIL